jgi:hypothetical protein
MIIFDILAAMIVFLLVIGVPSVLLAKRRQERLAEPKQKLLAQAGKWQENGELNEAQFLLRRLQVCTVCGDPTTPATDIYSNGCWYHTNCYGKVN